MHDIILTVINPIVREIRSKLSKEYNVQRGPNHNYRGLCNESCVMFRRAIEKYNEEHGTSFRVVGYHGEQKHSPIIDPIKWLYQHTWTSVEYEYMDSKGVRTLTIYVDPTSQQFCDLYDDIPDYYVSPIKPQWYMADKDNIYFKVYRVSEWVAHNIIGPLQYQVWGGICRIFRKVFMH